MQARFCDEFPAGFGWIADETLERAAHVLVADEAAWLVDPFAADGVEERIRAAGRPAGVIQLLDRHERDCAVFAERLGVPRHVVPRKDLAGTPFRFLRVVDLPRWREAALWWPAERVLVWADALGTARYFRARGETLAVHPLLRLLPPRNTAEGLTPSHVLCGHGEGVHGEEATLRLAEALATARRRIPRWLLDRATKR